MGKSTPTKWACANAGAGPWEAVTSLPQACSATASIRPRAKAAVLSRSTAALLEVDDDKIIVPEHIIRRRRPQLMPFGKADAAQEPDPGIHKIRISIVSESLGFACA
jgi:hypothetical protein